MSGFFAAFFSGIFWSLDSIALGYILFLPLVIAGLHDGFSFFLISLTILFNKLKDKNKFNISTKQLKIMVLAALLGGPIGMGSYVMSIHFLGTGLSAVLSSLYPIISALMAKFILKQRLSNIGKFGLFIAIIGTFSISLFGLEYESFNLAGIIFALLCVLGWGSECVIINLALKENLSPQNALFIRQGISFFTYIFVIFPVIYFTSAEVILPNFSVLKIAILAAVFGTISYFFYYVGIDKLGALKAMGLNISYSAWTILLSYFLGVKFSLSLFMLAIVIITGCILTNYEGKK